jgi:hypothetical protein
MRNIVKGDNFMYNGDTTNMDYRVGETKERGTE